MAIIGSKGLMALWACSINGGLQYLGVGGIYKHHRILVLSNLITVIRRGSTHLDEMRRFIFFKKIAHITNMKTIRFLPAERENPTGHSFLFFVGSLDWISALKPSFVSFIDAIHPSRVSSTSSDFSMISWPFPIVALRCSITSSSST